MPIRVLGDDGGGATDDVARGVDYARTHGADVINLSLGSEVPLIGATGGDAFDAAIRRALAAGIVVVAAAGNNGVPVCEQPAAGDGLLCVGAVDKRKQRSFFSSFGSGLGVVAPGGRAAPRPACGRGRALHLQGLRLRGAGGHVAGGAARRPASPRCWSRAACAGRRRSSGSSPRRPTSGTPGDDAEYGAGLVNARAAVAGLGGGAPAAGAPAGTHRRAAAPFVRVKRKQRARGVLRRGIRVRVRAVRAGRVRVRVLARGHADRARLARAPRRARGDRRRAAQPPRAGGWRAAGAFRARVRVRLPGERRDRVRKIRVR